MAFFTLTIGSFTLLLAQPEGKEKKEKGKGNRPPSGLIKPSMADTIKANVYADNWFIMYINGKLTAVDSIDFIPHNVVSVDILSLIHI